VLISESVSKEGLPSQLEKDFFSTMPPASGGQISDPIVTEVPRVATDEFRSAAVAIWQRAAEKLKAQVSPQSFATWFEPLVPQTIDGTRVVLSAPSAFIAEWVLQHYQGLIETVLTEYLGGSAVISIDYAADVEGLDTSLAPMTAVPMQQPVENRFEVVVQHPRENAPAPAPVAKPPLSPNLNPGYTFDSFIKGDSNKLAVAAAVAVANNPGGTKYNPLVMYGNVGLGKTHLIHAVGNSALEKFPGLRVYYTSSERFTKEFVEAIQSDKINDFNTFYRSIDLLIIDDVQFFAGKERTQDSFFHTFNELRDNGKQIILTCDRPPKELRDIDDRLLNRLQWGLTTDIQPPDLETRIAILREKSKRDGFDISEEVLEYLASNVSTNIRELEGCLISLEATISLEGKEPSIDIARDVLRKVARRSAPVLSVETIQKYTAKFFNIEEALLRDKTRKQEVVQARQVAMYLCKELTASTLNTIGLHFGGRDHSTVIHAQQTVVDDMRHDPLFANRVNELKRQLEMLQ
jgi:chromosomal replication initiator protein